MIKITNLSYTYPGAAPIQFPEWTLEKETHSLLLGNSGSGKTTLLHLIGGLLQPTTGQVSVAGTAIEGLSAAKLDAFRGKHIGFVFQKPHFIHALTLEENLYLAQSLARQPKDKVRVMEVLSQLDMIHKKKAKPHELSQGQAQRAAIARAVINQPEIILADEPTSSLDDDNCEKVIQLLLEQAAANNASLVIATHDSRLKSIIPHQLKL